MTERDVAWEMIDSDVDNYELDHLDFRYDPLGVNVAFFN